MEQLGAVLAGAAVPGIVSLEGELGTGKTTLVRGFLRGLGHTGRVRSPTYTLVEPYALAVADVYHLDLYRLADPEELEYLGLRDMLGGHAILLVEWPERGRGFLPAPDLAIRIDYAGDGRDVELVPGSEAGKHLLGALKGH